jgi:hypothetical protein
MRAVLALAILLAGCIAAEPGKETENASARKACVELEGRTFQSGVQTVSFVADDAEYSTYTETTPEGAQSTGIAQCVSVSGTNVIYLDGSIDHIGARADLRNPESGSEMFLRWTDGHLLTSF